MEYRIIRKPLQKPEMMVICTRTVADTVRGRRTGNRAPGELAAGKEGRREESACLLSVEMGLPSGRQIFPENIVCFLGNVKTDFFHMHWSSVMKLRTWRATELRKTYIHWGSSSLHS